eukprot:UN12502
MQAKAQPENKTNLHEFLQSHRNQFNNVDAIYDILVEEGIDFDGLINISQKDLRDIFLDPTRVVKVQHFQVTLLIVIVRQIPTSRICRDQLLKDGPICRSLSNDDYRREIVQYIVNRVQPWPRVRLLNKTFISIMGMWVLIFLSICIPPIFTNS